MQSRHPMNKRWRHWQYRQTTIVQGRRVEWEDCFKCVRNEALVYAFVQSKKPCTQLQSIEWVANLPRLSILGVSLFRFWIPDYRHSKRILCYWMSLKNCLIFCYSNSISLGLPFFRPFLVHVHRSCCRLVKTSFPPTTHPTTTSSSCVNCLTVKVIGNLLNLRKPISGYWNCTEDSEMSLLVGTWLSGTFWLVLFQKTWTLSLMTYFVVVRSNYFLTGLAMQYLLDAVDI